MLRTGKGNVTEEYNMIRIMRLMQWTVQEYEAQPQWIIETILGLENAEATHQNIERKKQEMAQRGKMR